MTVDPRLERSLPRILADLGSGPAPDYVENLLSRTSATRQRPRWVFPERWLPMAEFASRTAVLPRPPWRALSVALVVLALLVSAALAVVGSRPTKLPAPPFGPAANGAIAMVVDGDIALVDPVTGSVRPILAGSGAEVDPMFSPDGTRIAFLRANPVAGTPAYDIVVMGADGSNPVVVTPDPIRDGPEFVEWSPDGRRLLVDRPGDNGLWFYDATTADATTVGPPRHAASDAHAYLRSFRPPDGSAILILREGATGRSMVRRDLGDGENNVAPTETVLAEGSWENDLGGAWWSPDGSHVVYNRAPDGRSSRDEQRLHVVAADGTGDRLLSRAAGDWFETDVAWSPDGSTIAFNRWEHVGAEWLVRPVGVVSVADGSVRDAGPLPPSSGYHLAWSPDGRSLLVHAGDVSGHPILIDVEAGTWRELPQVVAPGVLAQSWQRLAP